jgi:hypothetical protein
MKCLEPALLHLPGVQALPSVANVPFVRQSRHSSTPPSGPASRAKPAGYAMGCAIGSNYQRHGAALCSKSQSGNPVHGATLANDPLSCGDQRTLRQTALPPNLNTTLTKNYKPLIYIIYLLLSTVDILHPPCQRRPFAAPLSHDRLPQRRDLAHWPPLARGVEYVHRGQKQINDVNQWVVIFR